ncbi:MAG: Uma2 family endonuclease [Pseudomonadota bacterium]
MQQSVQPTSPMTVDTFLAWAETLPRSERYELVDGTPIRMPAERVRHAVVKANVYVALKRASETLTPQPFALADGATLKVDGFTAFEPDAALLATPPRDFDAITVDDPLVVVEVLSPSTKTYNQTTKLPRYFLIPTVAYVLLIDPSRRTVAVHSRSDAATVGEGDTVTLDPPGITLATADFFQNVPR